jgi:exodeoxyribonuclease V beta subunit
VTVGGETRYVIADYKTNALHAPGGPAAAGDYAPDRLAAAMVEHDYPLQALLYSVALHRYLRWRLPGYDPERHLGGAAYLFVRGMDGGVSADGVAHGVFSWRVPPAMVERLSDLLDGALIGAGA